MSKKESEFDRYERMKKLEREAEMEKRKTSGAKKKSGRPKHDLMEDDKDWTKNYEDYIDEYDYI